MEDGAADKLPSEERKTRKRRKNGRQVHHFRKSRQAEHFLHLKTEKGPRRGNERGGGQEEPPERRRQMVEETPSATTGTTPGRAEAARETMERRFSSTKTDDAIEDHHRPRKRIR